MLSLVAVNPTSSFAPVSYIGFFGPAFFCECGEEGRDFSSSDISKIHVRRRRSRLKKREGGDEKTGDEVWPTELI